MTEEVKMYTCHVCGKPTPNYHEWWPSVAAIVVPVDGAPQHLLPHSLPARG